MRLIALVMAMAVFVISGLPAQAADPVDDYAVTAGRFYPQAGGFAITDDVSAPMWSEFHRLGGVPSLGYPVSGRYEVDGFVTQAMQKAILQWRPVEKRVVLANVLDDLSRAGKDDWLLQARQTPKPLPPGFDAGRPWDEVVKLRQTLLESDAAIKERYFAAPDPLTFFGLPTSRIEDMGNHVAIRLQRAVIQRWKVDVPWAKAGEVTVANGGDLYKEAGLIAKPALVTSSPALEGRAEKTPWSGWWWPVDTGVPGPYLFDANGPLARFDQLARVRGRTDVSTRDWELANLRLLGGAYTWAGHCNGWAAASILESEPTKPKTVDGVTFSIADQKGLLASWHFSDSAQWVYGDDSEGVGPADFHRALVHWLGRGRRAFVVNTWSGSDRVLNYPAYRFRLFYESDAKDPARTHVRATVWFVSNEVAPDFAGVKHWPDDGGRTYEYVLVGDRENPSGGAWEGVSASDQKYGRPWKIWYPTAEAKDTTRPLTSPQLDYATIRSILDAKDGA